MVSAHHNQSASSATVFPVPPPPPAFVRSSTEFSRDRQCTSTKLQLLVNRTEFEANNGYAPSHSRAVSSVSLLQATNQVTVLPATKSTTAATGKVTVVRNIPIKQLSAAMPPMVTAAASSGGSGPGCSSAAGSPSSASSNSHPRPLRVAQPPPLMASTAFPPSASSSKYLPNSVSVPALPKAPFVQNPYSSIGLLPFHRQAASASSGIGGRMPMNSLPEAPGQDQMPALAARATDRGRSRFGQMSHDELLELARNQQRQIEANEEELDERRKAVALFGVAKRAAANETEQQQNARILMANLRTQITRDELELAHLGNRQREAKQLREHNERQCLELRQLEAEYGHDDEHLRRAVTKVDSLRRQLELLYQRRATAADAAVSRQRRINGETGMPKERAAEKRPKASVVPFKQENEVDNMDDKLNKSAEKAGGQDVADGGQSRSGNNGINGHTSNHRRPPPPPLPPNYQSPINWRRSMPQQVDQFSIKRNSMTALKRLSWVAENGGDEYIQYIVNEQKKGRTHICFGETVPAPKLAGQRLSDVPVTWRGLDLKRFGDDPLSNARESMVGHRGHPSADDRDQPTDPDDRMPMLEAEMKRKAEEEEEEIKMSPERKNKGEDEQQKIASPVKRMVAVQENSMEFHKKFAEAERRAVEDEKEEKENNEKGMGIDPEVGVPSSSSSSTEDEKERQRKKDDEKDEEGMKVEDEEEDEPMLHELEPNERDGMMPIVIDPYGSSSPESSSSAGDEAPLMFDESCFALPSNTKSILRHPGATHASKKVMFDLIVLFLDVAYEGHYDSLVELASKIDNINVANSEGITALHYAICAGFVENVKFLIERGADVNVLDIDGWTPLHCAASCINLTMLRILIENGACPFATTSKFETAAQLFDESADSVACAVYLEMVEDCMGVINDGKVYTAYAYEAEHDDELSFAEGDELRVLRKSERKEQGEENGEGNEGSNETEEGEGDEEERQWWLSEHCGNGQRGLVPRNFLSLYPTWQLRSRYPSTVVVDMLPTTNHNHNGLPMGPEGKLNNNGIVVDDNGQSPSDQLGIFKGGGTNDDGGRSGARGHQELSTYA